MELSELLNLVGRLIDKRGEQRRDRCRAKTKIACYSGSNNMVCIWQTPTVHVGRLTGSTSASPSRLVAPCVDSDGVRQDKVLAARRALQDHLYDIPDVLDRAMDRLMERLAEFEEEDFRE